MAVNVRAKPLVSAGSGGAAAGRVRQLGPGSGRARGRETHVLYWMQQSQRAEGNAALEHALELAADARLPLLVGFGLTGGYPEANLRHYQFLLEGLVDVEAGLASRGVGFVVRRGDPAMVALTLSDGAAALVCDRGHLRHQRRWRATVAELAPCPVFEVEADLVVPLQAATDKREYAARTLRPKLHAQLERWLLPTAAVEVLKPLDARTARKLAGESSAASTVDLSDPRGTLASLNLDRSVPPVSELFQGGQLAARAQLARFLADDLRGYQSRRSRPETASVSHMGKYLHYGHISAVEVALAARAAKRAPLVDRASFLEELIIRRELAHNFVAHTEDYDRFSAVPDWARASLLTHQSDPRRPAYRPDEMEAAVTSDPYWNAAMREMKHTGYLHNALRMYWGKKILEWTPDPVDAHALALRLNNKYLLDGRDANSYANIGWIFGLHDRPFAERPIYGKVRTMSARGLERKSDIAAYVEQVNARVAEVDARAAG